MRVLENFLQWCTTRGVLEARKHPLFVETLLLVPACFDLHPTPHTRITNNTHAGESQAARVFVLTALALRMENKTLVTLCCSLLEEVQEWVHHPGPGTEKAEQVE